MALIFVVVMLLAALHDSGEYRVSDAFDVPS